MKFFRDPELSVMSSDGTHLSKLIWDISRGNSDAKLEDVIDVNAPVNEMPTALLFIESSIAVREVIASIKEHSMWASSSRVDDITKFEIDPLLTIESHRYAEYAREEMLIGKMIGFPQDRFRLSLPLTALTRYTVRLNMRACSLLGSYFKYLANLNDETNSMFRAAARKMIEVSASMGVKNAYPFAELLGVPINDVTKSSAHNIGSFTVVSLKAPFSLRTHAIRHRLFTVQDQLLDWVAKGIHKYKLNDRMSLEVSATNSAWRAIYSKRSCWIAQADLWDPMLKLVMEHVRSDESDLPCANGTCPVQKDCFLRLEGKDPNPPCPRHAELNKIELTDAQKKAIKTETNNRSGYWRRYA